MQPSGMPAPAGDAARSGAGAAAVLNLASVHPADAIEVLNRMDVVAASAAVGALKPEAAAAIFNHPGLEQPARLIAPLSPEHAAEILVRLHADRRVDVVRHFAPDERKRLTSKLPTAVNSDLDKLLVYTPEQAGGIMTTEFVSLPAITTVAAALQHLRQVGSGKETIYAIYLTDAETGALGGVVSLRELLMADPLSVLGRIALVKRPVTIRPEADREEAARLISKYDLLAVPVVDEKSQLLGIVTVDDVIDALIEENTEDLQKLGGVEALDQPYMAMSFGSMLRKRAGWLSVLFLSEMLTASAMQTYQSELEKAVVLTLFIPLIMSSGGNSGSQATSLIIRALALNEIRLRDWWRILLREIRAGVVLGAILGVIGIIRISVWQEAHIFDYGPHWQLLAATVGAALVGIVTFGSVGGAMLPFVLKRLGFDPASASAPFVATLVDVSGLVIYFTIAYAILKGTLL